MLSKIYSLRYKYTGKKPLFHDLGFRYRTSGWKTIRKINKYINKSQFDPLLAMCTERSRVCYIAYWCSTWCSTLVALTENQSEVYFFTFSSYLLRFHTFLNSKATIFSFEILHFYIEIHFMVSYQTHFTILYIFKHCLIQNSRFQDSRSIWDLLKVTWGQLGVNLSQSRVVPNS